MAMFINTNISSLNAQNKLTQASDSMNTAMERLSSGKRINSAKDDAAGAAIASKLTSQIKGINQATRNANDGISLIQTAEGALSESGNILQRMRELSVQSANGTYDSGNRKTLQAETEQLIKELDRISTSTNFNGLNLLDGSSQEVKLQIGAEAGQTIGISIGAMDTKSLGVADTAGVGSVGRTATGADLTTAVGNATSLGTGDLVINGIAIDGATAAADTASSAGKSSSAISTAAAINAKSDQTGVTAVVGETKLGGAAMTAGAAAAGAVTLNGVSINLSTAANDNAATRDGIVKAINLKSEQTGVTATDTGTDNGGITLTAADGRNIALETDANLTAANTGLQITDGVSQTTLASGTVTLVSSGGKEINITSGATGNASDAGFMEGTYSGTSTQVSSKLADSAVAMAAGNVLVNGVSVGPSVATDDTASSAGGEYSAIAKAAAFNAVSDKTGVTAVVNQNVATNDQVQTNGGGTVAATINGVALDSVTTLNGSDMSANRQAFVEAVNAKSDQTGVRAVDTGENGSANGGGVQLVADDGRNISLTFATAANGSEVGLSLGGMTADTAVIAVGEFTLNSDKAINIERGTDDNLSNSGLTVGDYGGGKDGQSISSIDISTVEGANKAITAIDNALEKVNDVRSDLGAANNRLDFTINNLSSISQNAIASRMRIEDADFASETASLSRSQVLMQASQAMLAQANSAPQQVLSLLR